MSFPLMSVTITGIMLILQIASARGREWAITLLTGDLQ
jgi:hypothetical protein